VQSRDVFLSLDPDGLRLILFGGGLLTPPVARTGQHPMQFLANPLLDEFADPIEKPASIGSNQSLEVREKEVREKSRLQAAKMQASC
jgi:hypothetical protein